MSPDNSELIPCACRYNVYTGDLVDQCPRHRSEREAADKRVKNAFMGGYYYGVTNQISEDDAWEAFND